MTNSNSDNHTPQDAFIVDDNGMPIGHIDVDRLQSDAVAFMYQIAATAGDDDATDAISKKWLHKSGDPDYFGYLTAATLSMLVRNVLGPTFDACDAAGLRLRDGLRRAARETGLDQ